MKTRIRAQKADNTNGALPQEQTRSAAMRMASLKRAVDALQTIGGVVDDLLFPTISKAVALLRIFACEHAEVVRSGGWSSYDVQKAEGLEYLGDEAANDLISVLAKLEAIVPSPGEIRVMAGKEAP